MSRASCCDLKGKIFVCEIFDLGCSKKPINLNFLVSAFFPFPLLFTKQGRLFLLKLGGEGSNTNMNVEGGREVFFFTKTAAERKRDRSFTPPFFLLKPTVLLFLLDLVDVVGLLFFLRTLFVISVD